MGAKTSTAYTGKSATCCQMPSSVPFAISSRQKKTWGMGTSPPPPPKTLFTLSPKRYLCSSEPTTEWEEGAEVPPMPVLTKFCQHSADFLLDPFCQPHTCYPHPPLPRHSPSESTAEWEEGVEVQRMPPRTRSAAFCQLPLLYLLPGSASIPSVNRRHANRNPRFPRKRKGPWEFTAGWEEGVGAPPMPALTSSAAFCQLPLLYLLPAASAGETAAQTATPAAMHIHLREILACKSVKLV